MTAHRCLLIADDLTGGADSGAQFAKRGLRTLLITMENHRPIDFTKAADQDVLVINTDSRGLSPEKAYRSVSAALKNYESSLFPVIYKKIDSTLRGNVGHEIDAIFEKTNPSVCIVAPSYPEQDRTLVNGILLVRGRPLARTEAANDAASPVRESNVQKLLQDQSRNPVGRIDLDRVAASFDELRRAVEEEEKKGNRILVFDAVTRRDLSRIAEAAFSMGRIPLLVGSAGLAGEVGRKLVRLRKASAPAERRMRPAKHIFIVSGSASQVTHEQLKRVEQKRIPAFELGKSYFEREHPDRKGLSLGISIALSEGHALLRTCPERLTSDDTKAPPIHSRIVKAIAEIAVSALEETHTDSHDSALVLTGGETALSVLQSLKIEGMEIHGEMLKGIVISHLIGGKWNGLRVVTKAGGFGKEDALEKVIEILEGGWVSNLELG